MVDLGINERKILFRKLKPHVAHKIRIVTGENCKHRKCARSIHILILIRVLQIKTSSVKACIC